MISPLIMGFLKSPDGKHLDIHSGYLVAIKKRNNTAIVILCDLVNEYIEVATTFKVSEVGR